MIGRLKKRRQALAALLLAAVLLLAVPVTAHGEMLKNGGENPNRKVVRVGYPIQANLTDKSPEGEYVGYNVDYLKEVCKYANWEIEYVEAEGDINAQITALGDMLDAGQIDMMGTMVRNEALEEMYLYPTYSYGSTYTALAVAKESRYWLTDSFSNWNGMTVATYPGLARRMALLENFAQVSGFRYETVEYETYDEVLNAVLTGEADACLQVDINLKDGFRAIARFSPNPYYFAINKGREDLQKDLNAAMYSLLEFYPSLQSELYSKYFVQKGTFHLSEEDRAWVQGLEPLRVLYYQGCTPIQDQDQGSPTGVAASFIKEFCQASGLKTVPVFAQDQAQAEQLVMEGKVDLIAAMTSDNEINTRYNVRLSSPYFVSDSIHVEWKGDEDPARQPDFQINTESTLNALRKGLVDGAKLDAYSVDYYLRKPAVYEKLYTERAERGTLLYAVGMLPTVDARLGDIINSYADSFEEQRAQSLLYEASSRPLHYTLSERFFIYRWHIAAGVLVAVSIGLMIYWKRQNDAALERAKDAERLYQFSQIVDTCLIHYNALDDRLLLQNSKIMFGGRETIQPFLASQPQEMARDENELRCLERLQKMLNHHTTSSEIELKKDGISQWYRINLVYVSQEYALGRMCDIGEEIAHRAILEMRANQDALTGVLNRFGIRQYMDQYLSDSQKGIFLLMDLDNFKRVNDTLGHLEGDVVLKKFASFLEEAFGDQNKVARLGGDEFVVFMPREVPQEELSKQLERFRQDVLDKVFAEYRSCGLSVSVGAAYLDGGTRTMEDLYRAADSAMYRAKNGGKNICFITGPMVAFQ